MAVNNATILTHAWLQGTNDFQQRIPEPTQGQIDSTIEALLDPMNKAYLNQFIDILVMRIGDTFVHQQTFRNPLRVFKKSQMRYGSTLQEIIPKWIRAHAYVDDAEDVFKMSRPDVAQWFHSQNRRDRYDITINRDELRTAFTEEGGLNRLVAAILDVPMNSDEYDEFQIMKELFAIYEQKWGFYKQQVSAINSEANAKAFLKQLRTYAGKLQFPNTIYNNGAVPDVPIFVRPSELVLFITPEVQASIDVDALAVLFNMDKADVQQRTILIDEFPMPNVQAILTTSDFFMCRDTEYTTTSMYNPKTLGTNYFLHHWGIYSVSPFVPAILFTTASGTSIDTYTQTVTGMSFTIDDSSVDAGQIVPTNIDLTGTFLDGSNNSVVGPVLSVKPDAASYSVAINRPQTGSAGVYSLTIGGTWAENDTVTVDGTVTTVASGSTATTAVASAIATAMADNTNYTVTASGSVVTITEKSGKYGIGAPTIAKSSTAGTVTLATTTEPVPSNVDVADLNTYVDSYGRLHVGNGLKSGDVITVTASSTYVNPSGSTTVYTDYVTATVN